MTEDEQAESVLEGLSGVAFFKCANVPCDHRIVKVSAEYSSVGCPGCGELYVRAVHGYIVDNLGRRWV